ncbi:MAG TPA: hypothetical protein VG676_06280 [Chitinophagaceae bacterium]|jgi:hypothetical protein|nr:hypothetical protein [Chitinophagaceae bacterium]
MKQQLKKIVALVILSCIMGATHSQIKSYHTAPWVSDKGYWVVESTIQDPLSHIVRFYNNDNELILTEYLKGVKLNIDKRKTKMRLKEALETAEALYTQHRAPSEIRDYVTKILR